MSRGYLFPRGSQPTTADIRSVCVVTEAGCWLWQHTLTAKGYGTIVRGKRCVFAHRFSWAAAGRSIPEGMELDHLCNVRSCVNPDHLEVVTHEENVRRRVERQTHCKRGHAFTPENTKVLRRANHTSRDCRACATARREESAA